MKRLLIVFSLLLSTVAGAKTPQAIYQKVSPSVFTVYSINKNTQDVASFGSAVAVTSDIVATNCHIFMFGNKALIEINGNKSPAQLVYQDKRHDLCMLKVPDSQFTPVELRPAEKVNIGEPVYAIGNPVGLSKSLSRGIVSNKHRWQGLNLLQTDASISKGSSGGGLFDEDGNLIGITTLMARNANDISLAIPSELVEKALNQVKNQPADTKLAFPKPTKSGKADVIATYNQKRIALVRHREQCFIFIFDKPMDQRPNHAVVWWPRHPNYLFLFPKPKGINKGHFKLDRNYPILSYRGMEKAPVVFAKLPKSARKLLQDRSRLGFGYRTPNNRHRLLFDLQGIKRAMNKYHEKCR